jgi:hypothetical protein
MITQQPIILDTIGKLADHGYCLAAAFRSCGHTADVDLDVLIGRLGGDAPVVRLSWQTL